MTELPSHKIPRYVIGDFKGLESIGIGAGGMVSRGKLQDFGQIALNLFFSNRASVFRQIALKQFVYSRENPLDKFKKEIDVLIEHRHPNIVQMFGILWNGQDQSIYLGYVMEYVEGGSLHDVIHKNTRPYDSPQIYKWIDQIARGLQFLHRHGIIHRDIKPENILVAGNHLKLADFGIAKDIDTSTTAGAGTLRYMAPEVFLGKCYPSSDIYSLAIVIWEIFHRKQPYYEWGNLSILSLIEKLNSGARPAVEPGKMDGDVVMLIKRCWQKSPENRPEIREIVEYFEQKLDYPEPSIHSNYVNGGQMDNLAEQMDITLTEQNVKRTVIVRQPLQGNRIQRIFGFFKNNSNKDNRLHHEKDDKDTILFLGGYDDKNILDDLLLLKENKWSKISLKLLGEIAAHGTVYLNREIYIFGGNLGNKTCKLGRDLEWVLMADMNKERLYISNTSLELNGYIWVFGGSSDGKGEKSLNSVERYDAKENKWSEMPSMNHNRRSAAAAAWNGKFLICGGWCDGKALKSVECFDPESGVWTKIDDLPTPLYGHALIPYRNNLVLIGGWNGKTQINSVLELCNTEGKQKWKKLPRLKNARSNFAAVMLNDEIYVIGGWNANESIVETEIFNGETWRDGPDLPHKNIFMSAITIPQNLADTLFNYKQ